MEEFRKSLYAACRQMNLEIVPKDIGARVMAFVGLAGADERVCYSPRLRCELEHLQEVCHIQGGDVPDKDFVERIQVYTKELQEYADKHNGEYPEWLINLISNRYGFKPYKL